MSRKTVNHGEKEKKCNKKKKNHKGIKSIQNLMTKFCLKRVIKVLIDLILSDARIVTSSIVKSSSRDHTVQRTQKTFNILGKSCESV